MEEEVGRGGRGVQDWVGGHCDSVAWMSKGGERKALCEGRS